MSIGQKLREPVSDFSFSERCDGNRLPAGGRNAKQGSTAEVPNSIDVFCRRETIQGEIEFVRQDLRRPPLNVHFAQPAFSLRRVKITYRLSADQAAGT